MKVLNFGSLNYDYTYDVDHMVEAGETLASLDMNVFIGGKGLNQSVALCKAGVPVYHGGTIGEDGDLLLETLKKAGVNVDYIDICKGKSGHTIIQVDKNGQNCILLYGGSNQKVTCQHINHVLSNFEKGDIILLQNEISNIPYIIDEAYKKGMQIILNPSPFNDQLKKADLTKVSFFIMNEIEGEQITGERQADKILQIMRQKYPRSKIVLTLGSDGSMYQEDDSIYYQNIFKVNAIDTTAAGDTFTGYFISGILEKLEPKEILKRSAMASAIAVTRKGATPSIPEKEEVLQELKKVENK